MAEQQNLVIGIHDRSEGTRPIYLDIEQWLAEQQNLVIGIHDCSECTRPINLDTEQWLRCQNCEHLQHRVCHTSTGKHSSVPYRFYMLLKEENWWMPNSRWWPYMKWSRYVCATCNPYRFMTAPVPSRYSFGRLFKGNNFRKER